MTITHEYDISYNSIEHIITDYIDKLLCYISSLESMGFWISVKDYSGEKFKATWYELKGKDLDEFSEQVDMLIYQMLEYIKKYESQWF
ncbi:MAG: hypothetical protein R3321_01185 [Nitrososphaeraceae archaeon]|nr:hypothetical protein [Nitrososphaeraceae archaeon]